MNIIFTQHARLRMRKRNIPEEEVFDAIKRPDKTTKTQGKYCYRRAFRRGTIEAVCEKTNDYVKNRPINWAA